MLRGSIASRLGGLPLELQHLSLRPIYTTSFNCYRPTAERRNEHRRLITTARENLEDNNTGHIQAGPNEGILFFDNIFPLKLRWLLRFTFNSERALERLHHPSAAAFNPVDLLKKALPDDLPVKINGVIPRLKEGGVFIRFSHDGNTSAEKIEDMVRDSLKSKIVRPWFNPFHRVSARLVKGRPWVEDLYRPPQSYLRVAFLPPQEGAEAKDITQEQLYSIFRPYGKLQQIEPQPPDSKIVPRYALLHYSQTKRGIMAKNCLHGINVRSETDPNTILARLKIDYEQKSDKQGWAKDWLFNHPRIVIPLLAAFAATVTVQIFDPIRTFNVKMHIKEAFHITSHPLYKWIASKATSWAPSRQDGENQRGRDTIWDDRRESIDQLESWLMETADTFIVVQGPRGSGKRELVVDMALKNRKDKLVIDCKKIQEARGDSATISATAEQVGYRPVFSWMNSISGLIDLAAQGATGMKTGFSETLDGQLNKILNNTASALRQLGLENRHKNDKDADISDDAYLEGHPEKRPVIVIDNFLHKSQESGIVYDKIAEWAASVTSANVAHVIFLTTDVSFSKSLGKALPDRVFRQIALGDCNPEQARRFVLSHLEAESTASTSSIPFVKKHHPDTDATAANAIHVDTEDLDQSLLHLGGRLTDLEFLARRIKAGETPSKAVREIIEQSASEILKIYIFNAHKSSSDDIEWTTQQAWTLIKQLANSEDGTLRYNELLLNDNYKGADSVLQALEQAEMIAIGSSNGRPVSIKPGKPVFLHAFKQLAADKVLAARMDMGLLSEVIKGEAGTIAKCEEELQLLGQLPKQPAEVGGRVQYLLGKIQKSQHTIEATEAEVAGLKKVLSTEF